KDNYDDGLLQADEMASNFLEIGITPDLLTNPVLWAAIKARTSLTTEHQLALLFDLIGHELEGMELEEFKDNEHIAGMVTPDNIFLYNGEHATIDSLFQTDTFSLWEIAEETLKKLHKAGHPEVCRRLSEMEGISYFKLCESIFGLHLLEKKPYPVHRIQINIRNIGDHNLTSIIKRINEMLRKTVPDPKNKRKLRQNVPVYVVATLEKDSQQRWKDTWYWINKAKLLEEDDPLLEYTKYTDSIGNTLSSRFNSAAYYFEDNEPRLFKL
ncbi:MAG TPA: hypothetical protein VIL29_06685, partial [Pseudothermotoga sp.]